MSGVYRRLIRPVLFAQEAENIHERTLRALSWVSRRPLVCEAVESFFGALPLAVVRFGLRFPNPVGLAAGMDKFADALPAWEALGFGFCELGGVTWHQQPGNPSPRLFRSFDDGAIINRMGFNNPGAEAFLEKLLLWRESGRWPGHPVGINLGKSKVTPLEQAPEDYAKSFRLLCPHADFFVINVSSPNTPGLRQLQDKTALDEILAAIQESQPENGPSPVLVKVSPDLSFEALDEILELTGPRNIAGIVATNTTTTRPQPTRGTLSKVYSEAGGLSGKPLRARSTEVIRHLFNQTRGQLTVIGVGGIFDADDAWEKITAGASLLQLYTALVYEGPSVASQIVKGLLLKLESAGLSNLDQAVGLESTKACRVRE
jgi:dihydroorotate dehydrogenase